MNNKYLEIGILAGAALIVLVIVSFLSGCAQPYTATLNNQPAIGQVQPGQADGFGGTN